MMDGKVPSSDLEPCCSLLTVCLARGFSEFPEEVEVGGGREAVRWGCFKKKREKEIGE